MAVDLAGCLAGKDTEQPEKYSLLGRAFIYQEVITF